LVELVLVNLSVVELSVAKLSDYRKKVGRSVGRSALVRRCMCAKEGACLSCEYYYKYTHDEPPLLLLPDGHLGRIQRRRRRRRRRRWGKEEEEENLEGREGGKKNKSRRRRRKEKVNTFCSLFLLLLLLLAAQNSTWPIKLEIGDNECVEM
jgi:hypothetical protein